MRSAFGERKSKGQPRAEDAAGDELSSDEDDEKEAAVPRLCVGELLERWDELPQIFTKAVRRRCLPKTGYDLAKGVAAARKRHDRPSKRSELAACSVARVSEKMCAVALEKGLRFDWTLPEKLPAYDAPSPIGRLNWMSYSPLCLLRAHLRGVNGLNADRISDLCASYQRALFERAACQGNDVLERYEEMERAFIFDVQEMSSGTGEAVKTMKHAISPARGRAHPLRPCRVSARGRKFCSQAIRSPQTPCRADVTSRNDQNFESRNRTRYASSIAFRHRSRVIVSAASTYPSRCGKHSGRLGRKPKNRPHPLGTPHAVRPLLCLRAPPAQALSTKCHAVFEHQCHWIESLFMGRDFFRFKRGVYVTKTARKAR